MKTEKTVTFKIDGQTVSALSRSPIIDAARSLGIEIPNLCHQPPLEAYGACRLCLVEVKKGKRTRVVTSCTYPAEEGIEVFTGTDRVKKLRKMIVELLLARCPGVEVIKNMAAEMGVTQSRFEVADDDCIMCGLCVRACRDLVGAAAISLVNRGRDREVVTPFRERSKDCIGCGVCVSICPTGAVKMDDKDGKRVMRNWKTEFVLKPCRECGTPFITPEHFDFLKKKSAMIEDALKFCPKCRAAVFGKKAAAAVRAGKSSGDLWEAVRKEHLLIDKNKQENI